MRICTSPSWRIASCAAVSAGRSRRTNNGPPGRVDPHELAVIIERDDCAVVVEFEQQGVDRLHPSELVGAGEAGEPQHGHHGAVYDDLLADRGGFDSALGRRGATGATEGGRGGGVGAWIRTRPTAPVVASMYQGPLSATITPERGGSVAAEAEANSLVAPLTRRLPPACHRAWPLSTSASSTSATADARTPVRGSVPSPSR